MRRREFLGLVGCAAGWPAVARAQQSMPVIGFLHGGSNDPSFAHHVAGFRKGLSEAGYVEGQNAVIEYRWAERQNERLPVLAADLVRRKVSAIVTGGGSQAALAARAATASIPIVFVTGSDPVAIGLVNSISRPGGNVTGIHFFASTLGPKQLELLREMAPQVANVGVLVNQSNPNNDRFMPAVQAAARALRVKLEVLSVQTSRDIDAAFATLRQHGADGLLVGGDPALMGQREKIVALATRYSFPGVYTQREFATAGGLMSYASNQTDAYRQAGIYVGRIVNGAKPADLPVLQPTQLQLVINLKTAKTLGLAVPMTLQASADEVIE
jgi:putative ABC transport system substrate-binding protein